MFSNFVLFLYFIVLQFTVCCWKKNTTDEYIIVKNLSFSITKLFIHFLIFQHVRRSIEAKIKPKTWYQDTCGTMQTENGKKTDSCSISYCNRMEKDWLYLLFQQMAATLFSVVSIETLYSRLAIINVNRRHA